MTRSTDIEQQLTDALAQRHTLATSIPKLMQDAERAHATRMASDVDLDQAEGDAMVGTIPDATLAKVRTRHEAALTEDRRAAATLRRAQQETLQLDAAIARLTISVREARLVKYTTRHRELVQQLRDGLAALRSVNDALHDNFRAAEADFPWAYEGQRQGRPRPYRVAAGLTDFSWPELRHFPHTDAGGRFGSWVKLVDRFLDPQPPTPAEIERQETARRNAKQVHSPALNRSGAR